LYQINRDGEIQTCDCLVIKVLIPYQIIISIQYLKLSSKNPKKYDLYYYLKFILQAETKDDCRVSQAKYSIVIAKKKKMSINKQEEKERG